MIKRYDLMIIGLFILIFAVWGCGPSEEEKQIIANVEDMPGPSPKLYLSKDELVLQEDEVSGSRVRYYLYGGSKTIDYTFQFGDEALREELAYELTMASIGRSSVKVEMILKQDEKETVFAQDSFEVNSEQYQPYSGAIPYLSTITAGKGDQFILRLNISGNDFGIMYSLLSWIHVLKPTYQLPAAVAEQRKKALTWVALNNRFGLKSELFTTYVNNLDDIILRGKDATWKLGWGLTKSKKPYILRWTGETFSAEEISREEAEEEELKEKSVQFTIN